MKAETITTHGVLPRAITIIASDDLLKLVQKSHRSGFILGVASCISARITYKMLTKKRGEEVIP